MKLLSLFSGIGAPETALKRLNINFELFGFSEIDKHAIKSYCAVHGVNENLNLGDITKINIKELPTNEIDLITHGSPCQDFSVAGRQAGGDEGTGTRSALMWYTVEIVKHCNPKFVLWENVKNVLSKKHIHNFYKYTDEMEKAGYKNFYKVLNAKDYGIPQNRERVFIISIRKDIGKDFIFPEPFNNGLKLVDFLEKEVDEKYYIDTEKANKLIEEFKIQKDKNFLLGGQQKKQAVKYDDISTTLTKSMGEGGGYVPIINENNNNGYKISYSIRSREFKAQGWKDEAPTICARDYKDPKNIIIPCITPNRINKRQNGRRFKENNDSMFTLTGQDVHGILVGDYRYDEGLRIRKNGFCPTIISRCGTAGYIATPLIIKKVLVCEERTDEGLRFFSNNNCGSLRTKDACGDKRILEFSEDV